MLFGKGILGVTLGLAASSTVEPLLFIGDQALPSSLSKASNEVQRLHGAPNLILTTPSAAPDIRPWHDDKQRELRSAIYGQDDSREHRGLHEGWEMHKVKRRYYDDDFDEDDLYEDVVYDEAEADSSPDFWEVITWLCKQLGKAIRAFFVFVGKLAHAIYMGVAHGWREHQQQHAQFLETVPVNSSLVA